MARVLLVDDDSSLLRVVRLGLRASGHEVIVATSGEQGIAQAALGAPDVIVLDLGLPDMDGLVVCRRIRERSEVPIVVLSANDAEDRKVAALDEGADDYVTKPFGMAELEARIRTAIRHGKPESEGVPKTLAAGTLSLDVMLLEAHLDSATIKLTPKEFEVLAFLLRHVGTVCTHQMILDAVWGTPYARESQYLHVYINRLRRKIGDAPGLLLKTVPGFGYVLTTAGKPSSVGQERE
jgi:two-component system KDP operon response regulator KdpE